MMNKQPFYHMCPEMTGDKKAIIKAIKTIKTVIKDTVEICSNPKNIDFDLMFTATSDVCSEANEKLKAIPGVIVKIDTEAEPGDPADLL